jgi:hypothetical protein
MSSLKPASDRALTESSHNDQGFRLVLVERLYCCFGPGGMTVLLMSICGA